MPLELGCVFVAGVAIGIVAALLWTAPNRELHRAARGLLDLLGELEEEKNRRRARRPDNGGTEDG